MLRNYISRNFILILVTLFIASCGGGSESSTNTAQLPPSPPLATSTFITVNYTAKVDKITGVPSFPVAIGDNLTGTFVYPANAKDWNTANVNQGYFHNMEASSGIHFQLNSLNFSSDLSTFQILIENDDASAQPTRDIFSISALSSLDSQVGISYSLSDFTATVFTSNTCNLLPQSLDINSFSNRYMFINHHIPNSGSTDWSIRLLPDSLVKQ